MSFLPSLVRYWSCTAAVGMLEYCCALEKGNLQQERQRNIHRKGDLKLMILRLLLADMIFVKKIMRPQFRKQKFYAKKRVNRNIALKWPNSHQKSVNYTFYVKVAHKFTQYV